MSDKSKLSEMFASRNLAFRVERSAIIVPTENTEASVRLTFNVDGELARVLIVKSGEGVVR